MRRWVLLACLLVFLGMVALIALTNAQDVPPQELQHRCESSRPAWDSYQEDIKGEIGAAPAAKWSGEIARVGQQQSELFVSFKLDKPWSEYSASIPILVRDPFGNTYVSATATDVAGLRVYRIPLKIKQDAPLLPWIEIHYPNREMRVSLNENGEWNSP